MSTLDEITKEKQRIGEVLARVEAQRDKLTSRSLCGFVCYRLASDSRSFRDPDVAGGDDLRSSLYSPQPSGVFRNCPGTFNLRFLRSAGSA